MSSNSMYTSNEINALKRQVAEDLGLVTESLKGNSQVMSIQMMTRDDGEETDFGGWAWDVTTSRGDRVSLYYEADYGDQVEIGNPPKYMRVRTDYNRVGYISISRLANFF